MEAEEARKELRETAMGGQGIETAHLAGAVPTCRRSHERRGSADRARIARSEDWSDRRHDAGKGVRDASVTMLETLPRV